MKKRGSSGRPIFSPKDGDRFQGITTRVGTSRLNAARERLAVLVSRPVESVSDGDVFEYLARGHNETKLWLKKRAAELTMEGGE